MITEGQIEKALDWLRDNAEPAAQARAERVYMEAWVKTVLAQCQKKHADLAVNAQEREARIDPEYIKSLDALREAVANDERFRFLVSTAHAKIEAWRSMESTRRAERSVG